MKKSVVALTALLALGLAACTPTNTSDSSTPSSTDPGTSSPSSETSSKPSQEQNFTSMSISNKDELQAAWYVEAEESRTINLDIDPATNQINLISSGKLTAISSNTAVAVCTGLGVTGVGVGTATITVTLKNDNGTTLTDTVDVTVTNRPVTAEGPIFTAPEDGVAMKFGAYNDSKANEGYWIFTGEMDGFYLGAVKVTDKATFDKQADVTPHASNGKWTLEVGTGKYLYAYTSTGSDGKTHNNVGIRTDAYEWTYDAANETFTTVLNETTYFIGGQKSYDTFSLSDIKHVSENLKANLCTWGKLDTEPEEPTDTTIDLATATERTIADLADKKDVDTAHLYKVTGILEGLDHTDKYGNAYVTDSATGKSIALYGMTTENVYTMVDGAVNYKNPETATETLADINNGEEVTLVVAPVGWSLSGNSVKYYSVLTEHKASTATYSITVDEVEHGTVSVTPNTASAYGTEATTPSLPMRATPSTKSL